jgi:eukaryotic-like serine/threonine-protein kinase
MEPDAAFVTNEPDRNLETAAFRRGENGRTVRLVSEAGAIGSDRGEHRASDPLAGTKYRILRKLGKGGMGDVYEVEHIGLGRRFVVKVMRQALANDPAYLERFRIEAQAIAALHHPNVVEVMDFGRTSSGCPYFVMERLAGTTITARLRARGVPRLAEALDWTIQALKGLDTAHRHGIVHRDIKPGNLFLAESDDGTVAVKLLDFGIAKLVDASKCNILPSAFATEKGVFIGTPQYASPEQGLGKRIDQRSDLYALGLVLYLLLAGRGPFDHVGKDVKLIAAQIARRPEPPSAYAVHAVPAELDAVVLKALEKDPKDRYQSAGEMAEALRAIRERHEKPEAPITRREPGAAGPGSGRAHTRLPSDERTQPVSPHPDLGAVPRARADATGRPRSDEGADTIVDPASFTSDSYAAPRPLTAHEATLILDDDTYNPFARAGTTHTAVVAVPAVNTSVRPDSRIFRPMLMVALSAVITAIAASIVLELVFR